MTPFKPPASSITPRLPNIDWKKGFNRHWHNKDPVTTHAFNALSLLFPQAESYFIAVVKEIANGVDLKDKQDLQLAIKNFIAQESIHTQQHNLYNEILKLQGYDNIVRNYVETLQVRSERYAPLTRLAIVCGYEHYTAILGDVILNKPKILDNTDADMALIWGWHAAEETEHKSVCFDLYHATGGGYLRRIFTFMAVTINFQVMYLRLYLSLLYRDGCLKPSQILATLLRTIQFFMFSTGIIWHLFQNSLRYFSPTFHPWKVNNRKSLEIWLAENNRFH